MKQSSRHEMSLNRVKTKKPAGPIHLALPVLVCLILVGLLVPKGAQAAGAPLDTMYIHTSPEETDPRYRGIDIAISRKKLPEVQATTVPQTKTPKRPPRLDDPLAARQHLYLAQLAEQQGNLEGKQTNLLAAAKADPGNPRFLWPMVWAALRSFDFPDLLGNAPPAFALQVGHPLYRGQILIVAQQATVLLLGIFWSMLVIALTLTWWPALAHDLTALLLRDNNHRIISWLPLLLPIGFLALRPGWFGFLALMSIPLLIQTRGHSRRLLAGTWLTAIFLVFPLWPLLKEAVPTIDPASEVNLLVRATTLEASRQLRSELDQRLAKAVDPAHQNRLRVALAIQEARRGRFKTSNNHFGKVLANDANNLPALVGQANNMYYLGRLDTAADLFHHASLAHPGSGVILYNQAQVFFKKLFITEAADALEKSRQLGFQAPVWHTQTRSPKSYSPVKYPGLSHAALKAACAAESGNYASGISLLTWSPSLGIPPIPLFLLLAATLLVATALILLWSHQHDPRGCENCGIPVCGDCCIVRQDAWLCHECGGTVDRARSDMILATLLKNRSRSRGMAAAATLTMQGRLFPGAGHLAIGRTFAAWVRLNLMSWGFFLMLVGWAFQSTVKWLSPGLLLPLETLHPIWAPLPAFLWDSWHTPLFFIGCGLTLAAWALAQVDATQLRHQMPEHFSLTLSSTRTQDEKSESRSVSVS